MNKNYLIYELKKWVRDPMLSFLLFYPLIIATVIRFALPYAEEQFGFALSPYSHIVIAVALLLTAVVTGAIIGFSILDDRDDKILYAIDVSPISINFFMGLRFALSFILTYISSIVVIVIANFGKVPLYALILVPISISLFSSISAMMINCFASNKIEGFAIMKGGALVIAFPIAALFFTDYKEFFFSFEPNFWAVKALSVAMQPDIEFNLGFWSYYFVGLVFVIALNFFVYKIFKRRIIS